MHWRGGRLDDVYVLPASAAVQPDKKVLIGELDNVPTAEGNRQIITDIVSQPGTTGSGNELNSPVENRIILPGPDLTPSLCRSLRL